VRVDRYVGPFSKRNMSSLNRDYEKEEMLLHGDLKLCLEQNNDQVRAAMKAQTLLEDFVNERRRDLLQHRLPIQFVQVQHKESYRLVLDCWDKAHPNRGSKISSKKIALNAEKILAFYLSDLLHLQLLQDRLSEKHICSIPLKSASNMDMFSRVLKIWSKVDDSIVSIHRIMEILNYMEVRELIQRNDQLEPRTVIGKVDATCYNIVIKALSKSNFQWKVTSAFNILKRMEERSTQHSFMSNCAPDVVSFGLFFKTCLKSGCNTTELKANIISMVIEGWEMIRNQANLSAYNKRYLSDHGLYCDFFRACAALEVHEDIIKNIFDEACANGAVSRSVIAELRKALSSHSYKRIVLDKQIESIELMNEKDKKDITQTLPASWSKNVVYRAFKSKRRFRTSSSKTNKKA